MSVYRRIVFALGLIAVLGLGSYAVAQVGPPGGTIYAHGVAYQTVATPTDLPARGRFDTIYVLGPGLAAVSDAAPGDAHYNGGRWEVRMVDFVGIDPVQFTSADEVLAAEASGDVEISAVVTRFVCPLLPNH